MQREKVSRIRLRLAICVSMPSSSVYSALLYSWIILLACKETYQLMMDSTDACEDIALKQITFYRYVSSKKMTWEKAMSCCESKDKILYTPELGDDGEGNYLGLALLSLEKELGSSECPYWSSGHADPDNSDEFLWYNGSEATKGADIYNKHHREEFEWEKAEDLVDGSAGFCLAIRGQSSGKEQSSAKIVISALSCSEERYFVCQEKVLPPTGGITLQEKILCEGKTLEKYYYEISDEWVLSKSRATWQAAKYCCEYLGMSLADNFVEDDETNEQILDALEELRQKKDFVRKGDLNKVGFWTGLNGVCKHDTLWTRPCGEEDDKTEKWSKLDVNYNFNPNETYTVTNPDNFLGNEYCGEISWRKDAYDDGEKGAWKLLKNDADCNTRKFYICEKSPKCRSEKRFQCDAPQIVIDPAASEREDELTCNSLTFEVLGNTSEYIYRTVEKVTSNRHGFTETNLLTWLGAMNCMKARGLKPASFDNTEDVSFFKEILKENRELRKKAIWIPATTWKKGSQPAKELEWWNTETSKPTGTPVPKDKTLQYKLHGNIEPACAIVAYHLGKVGVMQDNCMDRNLFVYKASTIPEKHDTMVNCTKDCVVIINATIPDPLEDFNFTRNYTGGPCVNRDIVLLLPEVCKDSHTTIQRPSAKQIELATQKVTQEQLHKLRFQNRKLKETVIDIATSGTTYYTHAPRNSFRLAALAAGVYIVQCPAVPQYFIEDLLHYLHRTHFFTSRGRSELIDETDFIWIKRLMSDCVMNATFLSFRTDECDELIYSEDKCDNFICVDPEYQFNITRYDPMLEAWWKIFEMSHAACFEFFHESYRMFHLYAQSFLDTWSEALRLRQDHQIQSSKFWERILGPEYELHLLNMDRCNEAVIRKSSLPFRMRLTTLPKRPRLHGVKEGKVAARK